MQSLLGTVLENSPLKDQEENVSEDKLLRFLRGYKDEPQLAADAYLSYIQYVAHSVLNPTSRFFWS